MYNDDDDDVNGDVDMMHCSGAATSVDVFVLLEREPMYNNISPTLWMLMSILVAMT